jgi:hypothetical protein
VGQTVPNAIWCVSCTVVVLTCFVICGCFENCVCVLVICVLVFTVFCIFPLCIFSLFIFLFKFLFMYSYCYVCSVLYILFP